MLPSVVQLLRVQGLFREAVLALWAADLADLKLGRALIRAIQARRLLAPVADERVLLPFQDRCPALGGPLRARGRSTVGRQLAALRLGIYVLTTLPESLIDFVARLQQLDRQD